MSEQHYSFDHILDKYVGGGGRWQWQQYLLFLLMSVASSIALFLHMFSAYTPSHRCQIPRCDAANSSYEEPWVRFAVPKAGQEDSFLRASEEFAQCSMFKMEEGSECAPDSFSRNETVPCGDYVYDKSVFTDTLTTELDLVCSEAYKVEMQGTILMVGLTVGFFIGGPMADKFGRKKTLILAVLVMMPSVIVGGFISNFAAFSAFRCLTFLCTAVMWVTGHTLLLEQFGSETRKVAYVLNSVLYSAVNLITPLIAYLERDWNFMHLWTGLIIAATIPLVVVFMSESVRWNLLNGKAAEAEETLWKMAETNGKHLTEDEIHEIRHIAGVIVKRAKECHDSRLSPLDLFGKKLIWETLIVMSIWITSVVGFYALALNATSLAGDLFTNYVYSALIDIPSVFFVYFFIDRIGRRFSQMLSLATLGACCVAMAFTPKDVSAAVLTLYLIGKYGSSCSMNIVWLYTAELYPTNLRAQAVATCSMVGRIFGAFAPYVARLGVFWSPLPFLVLGIPPLVAGLLTLKLPETSGKGLPETSRDVELVDEKETDRMKPMNKDDEEYY